MTNEEFMRVKRLALKMLVETISLDNMAKEAEILNDSKILRDIENQRKKLDEIKDLIDVFYAKEELQAGATIN